MFVQSIFFFLSLILTLLFFMYGYNHYYLLNAARHYSQPILKDIPDERPPVSIQLPIYNEKYVVRRLLAACTDMVRAYGMNRANILILDDSDDDTVTEIDTVVAEYVKEHFHIEIVRRGNRQGFKAGALKAALEKTPEDFIAIFDADFTPREDFLIRTIPYMLQDENLAIVQTCWGHLNRDFNFLTKGTAILMDMHFIIEQSGRYAEGLFQNFNGSGGVLKKKAIIEAGGWQADTLAEDLDLSYRMQILGYRVLYLRDLKTPGEIPPTIPNHKQQQSRWACGSLRTARKILPLVLPRREISFKRRLQSFIHLTGYFLSPMMTLSFILTCVSTFFSFNDQSAVQAYIVLTQHDFIGSGSPITVSFLQDAVWFLFIPLIFLCTIAPLISAITTLRVQKLSLFRNLASLLVLLLIGFGTSLNNTLGAAKALFSNREWEWTRTPKYSDLENRAGLRSMKYQINSNRVWLLELAFACAGAFAASYAIRQSNFTALLILIPFSIAYAVISILTILQR
jgi:cellulose synthase/poly-beta-1,6-N-acetylglucosamine synthase-like glycosyltransferase